MGWRRVSPRSRWFVVLLSVITTLAPLGIDTSLPALPVMARALATSDGVIAATLGSFMLAFALGQLIVGPVSDRFGRRPVIIGGAALFALAGLLCAGATNGIFLVVARFFQGLGACAGAVGGRAIIRDVFTDRMRAAKMQAYAGVVSGVVPMLAPLLGAAVLPLGWRAIYLALVVGGLLLLAATALWLPETLRGTSESARTGTFERYRAFLALPRSVPLCLLVACSFAGLFTLISGSPFVLVRELGLSNTAFGIAFAISSGAILVGSWTTAMFAHRVAPERLLACASIAAAILGMLVFGVNVLLPHQPAAWEFVATMAAYAFTFGLIIPNVYAAGMEEAGKMAGVASGMLGATQMLGGSLGSVLSGALPYKAYVNIGLTVGVAGIGVALAYIWSLRAGRLGARIAYDER